MPWPFWPQTSLYLHPSRGATGEQRTAADICSLDAEPNKYLAHKVIDSHIIASQNLTIIQTVGIFKSLLMIFLYNLLSFFFLFKKVGHDEGVSIQEVTTTMQNDLPLPTSFPRWISPSALDTDWAHLAK